MLQRYPHLAQQHIQRWLGAESRVPQGVGQARDNDPWPRHVHAADCCTFDYTHANSRLITGSNSTPMTLTELKYIVAVAREKHFGRAADACYVSQPTLVGGHQEAGRRAGREDF